MNTSQPSPRRRKRGVDIGAEALETRALLTSGAGNTFAIMQASIDKADVKTSVPFVVNSTLVSKPTGRLTIGIDVAAQNNSTAVPKIVGLVDDTTHRAVPITHAIYNPVVQRVNPQQGDQTAAILATIQAPKAGAGHSYTASVIGMAKTTGGILVGFYLPGDANGDGLVDKTDIATIQKAKGGVPGDTKYSFPADANRDGRVNNVDLSIARGNLGAKIVVSPVVSADLSRASDSGLADRVTNLNAINFTGTATPGATVTFDEASVKSPKVTAVADATGKYSINVGLGAGSNTFRVTSTDGFGQTITGLIAPVTYNVLAPGLIPSTTATT